MKLNNIVQKYMEDQIIYNFSFSITPLEVRQSNKIYTSNKAVVLKLGNKEGKCKALNQSIKLRIPVLFSQTLNQFCPVKGIIKIYDVADDGSEMISSVGAFQTEDLLNEGITEAILTRDVGPCKLKMSISYKKEQNNQERGSNDLSYESSNQESQIYPSEKEDTKEKKFLKKYHSDDFSCSEPYLLDDSSHQIDEFGGSNSGFSELSEELRKNQLQILGEQLLLERRQSKVLEQKLEKSKIKTTLLKKKVSSCEKQIRQYLKWLKKITECFQIDEKNLCNFDVKEKKIEIALNKLPSKGLKGELKECFKFALQKITNPTISLKDQQFDLDQNEVFRKLSQFQNQKINLLQQNNKLKSQLDTLLLNMKMKYKELQQKQKKCEKKQEQLMKLDKKHSKLLNDYKSLQGMNQYLQQKDLQMENLISTKETTIQNLRKMVGENNMQIESLDEKCRNSEKIINNLELTIEEMKEQISNLSETIEMYRLKYGDLKLVKDKALQRQIRDCLRWIDQQNREEELSLQETGEQSVTSFIKSSIQDIEQMPIEQISVIRKEIVGILKKVDELMAKNSI